MSSVPAKPGQAKPNQFAVSVIHVVCYCGTHYSSIVLHHADETIYVILCSVRALCQEHCCDTTDLTLSMPKTQGPFVTIDDASSVACHLYEHLYVETFTERLPVISAASQLHHDAFLGSPNWDQVKSKEIQE